MNIKELLLNGKAFLALLKEFAIDANNIRIHDENVLLTGQNSAHQDTLKQTICVEGKGEHGTYNLFGVVHCNLINKLAVFEMHGFEQLTLKAG